MKKLIILFVGLFIFMINIFEVKAYVAATTYQSMPVCVSMRDDGRFYVPIKFAVRGNYNGSNNNYIFEYNLDSNDYLEMNLGDAVSCKISKVDGPIFSEMVVDGNKIKYKMITESLDKDSKNYDTTVILDCIDNKKAVDSSDVSFAEIAGQSLPFMSEEECNYLSSRLSESTKIVTIEKEKKEDNQIDNKEINEKIVKETDYSLVVILSITLGISLLALVLVLILKRNKNEITKNI